MAITIRSVRCAHYHLPRAAWWDLPLEDHTLPIDAIDLVVCEIDSTEGVPGLGYTYTLSHGGGAVYALLVQEIAPLLIGQPIDRPEPVWHALWRRMLRYGRGGVVSVALAAVDVALWDACARAAEMPLYRYLGAQRESVPVYGSSIDLGYSQETLLETVRGWQQRGFSAVKVKVGRSLSDDLVRLTAVRDVLGAKPELMVDANNGWDFPDAKRRIAAMAAFDLTWVEEPLMPDDIAGHARLEQQSGIPIAAGETLFSVADFARYLDAGAISYVQADVGRVGGITPWLAVAHLAAAHHLPMAPHFLQDIHVHLLCAVPNAHRLEYLPLLDAVIETPLHLDGTGQTKPSATPGVGVRFRTEVVNPHLTSQHELTA